MSDEILGSLAKFTSRGEMTDAMLRKLESLKQDLGDGVANLAQRTVHAAQEYLLNPFAIQELSTRDFEHYDKYKLIETGRTSKLYKSDKWIDAVLISPRVGDSGQKNSMFRFIRFSLQKENEALEAFARLALVLDELDIPILYTTHILQNVLASARREPNWSSAHVAVDISLKSVFSVNAAPSAHLGRTDCDSLGRSPLALAVKQNKREMVEHLITIGAPTGSQDHQGDTIYHYCLEMGDEGIALLQYLISHHREPDPAANLINSQGESPLHVAVRLNREKFFALLVDGLNVRVNVDAPKGRIIHYILKFINEPKRRAEWIDKVVQLGADEVNAVDEKYGGTPLHWARSKDDITQLVKFGAQLEQKSITDDRALHIMVVRKRADAAYTLILNGAEINRAGQGGNTPLHYACQSGDITLVKALILFGADCNAKNGNGKTPGLLAIEHRQTHGTDDLLLLMKEVGSMVVSDSPLLPPETLRFSELSAKDAEPILEMATPNPAVAEHELDMKRSKSLVMKPKIKVDIPRSGSLNERPKRTKCRKKLRVLCLDGGGIRGLVLTQILLAIEQASGRRLDEMFDYISGTSTGGMLALALLKGLTSRDIQRFYLKLKDECFHGKRPYSHIPLEANLKELYGETKLHDIAYPRVMVTTVVADRQPTDLSYVPTGKVEPPAMATTAGEPLSPIDDPNLPLWKAARCTGAAPSYFPAMERFLDGGLAANNPTFDTIVEIQRELKAQKDDDSCIDFVLSVGTGNQPIVKSRAADAIWPSSVLDAYKSISATVELAKVFVDTVCEADRWVVQRSKAWCEMADIKYHRLNPQLTTEVQLDETNDEALFNMMWETKKYLNQNTTLIAEIVNQLRD